MEIMITTRNSRMMPITFKILINIIFPPPEVLAPSMAFADTICASDSNWEVFTAGVSVTEAFPTFCP